MVTVQVAELAVFLDCPACGEDYIDGEMCECGYCPHPGVIEGTCPLCGTEVEPTMAALVAELLDAADCMVTELAKYPMLLSSPVVALRSLDGPTARLRQIVTVLQGTAGLRVVEAGNG